jgi:hypothetical protein
MNRTQMVGVMKILMVMMMMMMIIIIIILIIHFAIIKVLAQRPLGQLQRQHRDIREMLPERTYKLRHVQRGNKNESRMMISY